MADNGNIINITNGEHLKVKLDEAKEANKIVVINFTTRWLGPCYIIGASFVDLSKQFPGLMYLQVDADKLNDLAAGYEVRNMPTFLFLKDGKVVNMTYGADANQSDLQTKVAHYASINAASA